MGVLSRVLGRHHSILPERRVSSTRSPRFIRTPCLASRIAPRVRACMPALATRRLREQSIPRRPCLPIPHHCPLSSHTALPSAVDGLALTPCFDRRQALHKLELGSSREEFNDLCYCLTLPNVRSHPDYASWTPHLGRLWCFEALRGYLGLIFPGQETPTEVCFFLSDFFSRFVSSRYICVVDFVPRSTSFFCFPFFLRCRCPSLFVGVLLCWGGCTRLMLGSNHLAADRAHPCRYGSPFLTSARTRRRDPALFAPCPGLKSTHACLACHLAPRKIRQLLCHLQYQIGPLVAVRWFFLSQPIQGSPPPLPRFCSDPCRSLFLKASWSCCASRRACIKRSSGGKRTRMRFSQGVEPKSRGVVYQ